MKPIADVLTGLPGAWRDKATDLEAFGAAPQATALRWAATQLEHALGEAGERTLTLTEAAAATGYSADHLGRLVRDGRLPNAGRPNAPKIRAKDLPAPRPGHMSSSLRAEEARSTFPPARAQIAEAVISLHKRVG